MSEQVEARKGGRRRGAVGGGGVWGGACEVHRGDGLALDGVVEALEVAFEVEAYGVLLAGDGVDVDEVAVEGEERGVGWIVKINVVSEEGR